jgi:hypothetical protein
LIVRVKQNWKNNTLEYEGYCELFNKVERTEEGFTTRAKYYDLSIFEENEFAEKRRNARV